jgi:hypothetical protein
MQQISRHVMRFMLLAMVGFLLATAVRPADASPTLLDSNYAVAYMAEGPVCTGNPGNDCDRPDQ